MNAHDIDIIGVDSQTGSILCWKKPMKLDTSKLTLTKNFTKHTQNTSATTLGKIFIIKVENNNLTAAICTNLRFGFKGADQPGENLVTFQRFDTKNTLELKFSEVEWSDLEDLSDSIFMVKIFKKNVTDPIILGLIEHGRENGMCFQVECEKVDGKVGLSLVEGTLFMSGQNLNQLMKDKCVQIGRVKCNVKSEKVEKISKSEKVKIPERSKSPKKVKSEKITENQVQKPRKSINTLNYIQPALTCGAIVNVIPSDDTQNICFSEGFGKNLAKVEAIINDNLDTMKFLTENDKIEIGAALVYKHKQKWTRGKVTGFHTKSECVEIYAIDSGLSLDMKLTQCMISNTQVCSVPAIAINFTCDGIRQKISSVVRVESAEMNILANPVFKFKFIDTVENMKIKENAESGISSGKSVSNTSSRPSGRTPSGARGRGLGKKTETKPEIIKKSASPEKPKSIPEQAHFDLPKNAALIAVKTDLKSSKSQKSKLQLEIIDIFDMNFPKLKVLIKSTPKSTSNNIQYQALLKEFKSQSKTLKPVTNVIKNKIYFMEFDNEPYRVQVKSELTPYKLEFIDFGGEIEQANLDNIKHLSKELASIPIVTLSVCALNDDLFEEFEVFTEILQGKQDNDEKIEEGLTVNVSEINGQEIIINSTKKEKSEKNEVGCPPPDKKCRDYFSLDSEQFKANKVYLLCLEPLLIGLNQNFEKTMRDATSQIRPWNPETENISEDRVYVVHDDGWTRVLLKSINSELETGQVTFVDSTDLDDVTVPLRELCILPEELNCQNLKNNVTNCETTIDIPVKYGSCIDALHDKVNQNLDVTLKMEENGVLNCDFFPTPEQLIAQVSTNNKTKARIISKTSFIIDHVTDESYDAYKNEVNMKIYESKPEFVKINGFIKQGDTCVIEENGQLFRAVFVRHPNKFLKLDEGTICKIGLNEGKAYFAPNKLFSDAPVCTFMSCDKSVIKTEMVGKVVEMKVEKVAPSKTVNCLQRVTASFTEIVPKIKVEVTSSGKKYDSDGFTDSEGGNEANNAIETQTTESKVETAVEKAVEKVVEKVAEKEVEKVKPETNSKSTEVVYISAATCPSNPNAFYVQRSSIEETYTAIQDCLLKLPMPGSPIMKSMNPGDIEPFVYGLHYSPESAENEDPGWKRANVSDILENGDLQLIYVDSGILEKCNPKDFYAIPAEFQADYEKFDECATCVIFEGTKWPGAVQSFLAELDETDTWNFQFLEKEPLDNYYNYARCEEIQRIAQKYQ